MLKDDWVSGDSFTANDQNDVADAVNEIVRNVENFGAVPDNEGAAAANTIAIHAAIAAGGITFFPPGTWWHTGLTIAGAHLKGVGPGSYWWWNGAIPDNERSILKLADGSDTHCITVGVDNANSGVIEHLEIDGNQDNQASGNGIHFTENPDHAEETEWHLRHVEIHHTKDDGLYIGDQRIGGFAEVVKTLFCGGIGINILGSDWTFIKPMVGLIDSHGIQCGAVATRLIGGECFTAGLSGTGSGMNVTARGCYAEGMHFNFNNNHGVLIDGEECALVGCRFADNGYLTNNTYSDIKVDIDFANVQIIAPIFGQNFATVNQRKYCVELGSNGLAQIVAPVHVAVGTGTAFSDQPGNLYQVVPEHLQAAKNDLRVLTLTSNDSAVNRLGVGNHVTGSSPYIYALGNDTDIGVDFVPKGAGVFKVNGNPAGVKVAVPSTATSTGVLGQWAADASFHYTCTATNTWRRVAHASW